MANGQSINSLLTLYSLYTATGRTIVGVGNISHSTNPCRRKKVKWVDGWMDRSIDRSIDQLMDQWIDGSMNQSIGQSIDWSISQLIDWSIEIFILHCFQNYHSACWLIAYWNIHRSVHASTPISKSCFNKCWWFISPLVCKWLLYMLPLPEEMNSTSWKPGEGFGFCPEYICTTSSRADLVQTGGSRNSCHIAASFEYSYSPMLLSSATYKNADTNTPRCLFFEWMSAVCGGGGAWLAYGGGGEAATHNVCSLNTGNLKYSFEWIVEPLFMTTCIDGPLFYSISLLNQFSHFSWMPS